MQKNIFEDHQEQKLRKYFSECKINFSEPLEYPPVAISMGSTIERSRNGNTVYPIPIGTYGNFSMITAPPKTKKTYFVSLLVSTYISGKNNFSGNIRGHRDNKSILHFDTEQGHWHCQRVFKRTNDMANIGDCEKYYTFGLRTITQKDKLSFIEYTLKKYQNVGLVVIDGIADLISDPNDYEQSNMAADKLLIWSAKYNCHIITVIHSTYGTTKAKGHLGSLLGQRTETEINLEANTVNKQWVTVKCQKSRGFPFETFSFYINDYGYPEVVGDLYDPLL
tara:strand:- start:4034 stop:4870 length:837 start_codon:yes stop_codon:yes gene_type:complete